MKPFDGQGAFCPVAAGPELRRLAVRGAGFTVFAHGLGFAIQMIAIVVLARLLTPADFGLTAMVTTFSLLLANVGLNGFTEAILQRDEIDHGLASNLFWINTGIGVSLTIAFASAGPLLANLYGDPRVALVTVVMSLTILFTSLSVLHLALLKRAMRFSVVSTNDFLARVAAVSVSIVLGWAAWGYWALVGGAVALPLVTCIAAWSACRWLPGLPRRRAGTGPMVRFAMNTYARFAASYFSWNLDNLLIGWRFGPASLGFYKKAYDLFVMPTNQLSSPLTSVAVSALSRVAHDPAEHRRSYLSALSTLAFIGMGLGASLTVIGSDLILLLMGPGWEESGRIFTFFGPGIGIMLLYGTHGWLHLSLGRADRWFRWGLVEFGVIALLFLVALPWGPVGVALAWVAAYWLLTIPALWYAGQPAHLGIGALIGAVWKFVVASALAGFATAVIIGEIPLATQPDPLAALTRLLTGAAVFGALYLGAVILLHQGLAPLVQVGSLLRHMLPPGGFSKSPATAAPVPATVGNLPIGG
jgi:PST family polysaccharide transporter